MKQQTGYFVMNAAGTCKNLEDVINLCKVDDLSAILLGSVTMLKRAGNSGDVYNSTSRLGTLNSLGMNNAGFDHYASILPAMVNLAHTNEKKFGISVAAIDGIEEYIQMAEKSIRLGVDFIELNGGCPNVWDSGKQHRILTFDPISCQQLFSGMQKCMPNDANVYFKVSPISDPAYIQDLALVINEYPVITGITATNTFPNGHGRDSTGRKLISVGKGLAGVSGLSLKYISKGQVLQWHDYLLPEKEIIAAGGIDCGQDILDYGANGAVKFQIGTALFDKGLSIFGTVLAEAEQLRESYA